MKILFNAIGCGIGNNGGSLTIVNSANALVDLGHDVYIIDAGANQHTWTKLKCKHLKVSDINKIPKADVAITTGFNTCKRTLQFPAKIKVMWLRGWETWKISEENIINNLLPLPLIKVVNGIGLQEKLKQHGHESYLIRPGHTFEDFSLKNIKKNNIVLGGLYHSKHSTKRHEWCINTYVTLKKKYPNLKLHMFGVTNTSNPNIDKYLQNPSKEEKNNFYNRVDIWLSPSILEGLHITPAEAMLCETPVITTNTLLAGTKDYVINGETGLISKNNIKSFINQTEVLIKNKELRIEMGIKARKKIIELGSRHDNMKLMVELFEGLIK